MVTALLIVSATSAVVAGVCKWFNSALDAEVPATRFTVVSVITLFAALFTHVGGH